MPRHLPLAFLCLTLVFNVAARCRGGGGPPPAPTLSIDSPANGTFSNDASIAVTGSTNAGAAAIVSLTVNGIDALPLSAGSFQVVVPLDPAPVFNPLVAEMTLSSGKLLRRRVTVVAGDGVDTGFVLDGDYTPQGLAVRFNETGLDQIAPLVEDLSAGSLDIGPLITGQNPILEDECVVDSIFGCLYFGTVNVTEVGFSGFSLDARAGTSGALEADVTIDDFYLELDLEIRDLVALEFSCGLEIEAATTTVSGDFDLAPLPADPTLVDVNLLGSPAVSVSGFEASYISGLCDSAIIGDIIQALVSPSMIEGLVVSGFEANLADPDAAGPLDSPLAGAIQEALAGVSIAGPAGEGLGVLLDTPIDSISEDPDGLTLVTDASITAATPDPLAPDLPASYTVAGTLPALGATAPVGGAPYGLAFAIGTSAMNQLLKAQTEGGLLRTDLTQFSLPGGGMLPLNAGLIKTFIPEVESQSWYTPGEPAVIEVRPTLAPVFTGNPGPAGELAALKIAALEVTVTFPGVGQDVLGLQVDLDTGVDLAIVDGGLSFALGALAAEQIDIDILDNPLESNEDQLSLALEVIFPLLQPVLESALGEFPVPSFLGLELTPVEVAQVGDAIGLFTDLTTVPTSTLQNVLVTDLSSGDSRSGGGCWIDEWRHRVSDQSSATSISANLRGVLGADAGCTTNDNTRNATASYRLAFDVLGVAGEQWTLDIDHSIRGALTIISDAGALSSDGGGTARFDTDVTASYQIAAGASGSFDFTPSVTSISDGVGGSKTTIDQEFTGANGVSLVGTGTASVTVDVSFSLHTHSNSNTIFPIANGDEAAVRLGKADTITSNFDAGNYPGVGGRNAANDGHFLDVSLSVAPLP